MNRVKALCLITALATFSVYSCSEEPEPLETTAVFETSAAERTPYIERCDYNGAEFNIVTGDWGLYSDFFFADEQTGDQMNDAIFERERLVEEYLGVEIGYNLADSFDTAASLITSQVMSGDDSYQLSLTHCIMYTASFITQGVLCDWNEIESVDLSREYWNQSCNDALSIYGKQYYAVSDYMIADPNAILFNKQMVEDYDLENPYTLVYDYKWTIDKLNEMCAVVTNDLSGDSIYDVNDQYGISSEGDWMLCSLMYSAGIRLTEKNDEDGLDLVIGNERTYTLIDKLNTLINGSNDAYFWAFGAPVEDMLDMKSGRVLFNINPLRMVNNFRDCDVEFGIIPFPLLDESQTKYEANDWSGLMCVPLTAGDLDMVGKVCEMLAFYSADTTIPAYYDVVLGEKLARDDDSRKMLDIIFDGIVYDAGSNFLGQTNNMFNLYYTIPFMIFRNGSGDFASWYGRYEQGALGEIDQLLDDIKN